MLRAVALRVVSVLVLSLLGLAPAHAGYALRVVAETGDTVPDLEGADRVFFDFDFSNVFVLENGDVVFGASLEDQDTGFRAGVFYAHPDRFETMGLNGEPVPGLGDQWFNTNTGSFFGFQLYRDLDDQIALHMGESGGGVPADSPAETNFLAWEPGAGEDPGAWRIVFRGGDQLTGLETKAVPHRVAYSGGLAAFNIFVEGFSLPDYGALGKVGPLRGQTAGILARYDPAPHYVDYEVEGVEDAGELLPAMNPSGTVVFSAIVDKLEGSEARRSLYTYAQGTGFTQVVEGLAYFGNTQVQFDAIALNEPGDVGFSGLYNEDTGLWVSPAGGGLRTVALNGDAAPGTPALFKTFEGFILRDDGSTAFIATTTQEVGENPFTRDARGAWVEVKQGEGYVLQKLMYDGDQPDGLDGEQVIGGATGVGGLVGNGRGDLAVTAEFSDGGGSKVGLWRGDAAGLTLLMNTFDFVQLGPGDSRFLVQLNVRNSPFSQFNPGPGVVNAPIADGRQGLMNENGVFALEAVWGDNSISLLVVEPGLVVNSTGTSPDLDPGDGLCDTGNLVDGEPECTLRAAIQEAHALEGRDRIVFDIPDTDPGHDAGVWTIAPGPGEMPLVESAMEIDASTQPGYAGSPVVVLDGSVSQQVNDDPGFSITGNASEIRGFCVIYWGGQGFRIVGDENVVAACYIGIGPDGAGEMGNHQDGVLIIDAAGNRIGGEDPADRCVVANNGLGGGVGGSTGEQIRLQGPNCIGNQVAGCFIGTDASGLIGLTNPVSGVSIFEAQDNLVGPFNLISAHNHGVDVDTGVGNRVEGNWIGLNSDGDEALPNTRSGVQLRNNSTGNVIGGLDDQAGTNPGNLISGNSRTGGQAHGVWINTGSHNNVVQGNAFGLDGQQVRYLPNSGAGIFLDGVDSTQVGDLNELGGNLIGKSGAAGIHVKGGAGTELLSNYVGQNPGRTWINLPYNKPGILIEDSMGNLIEQGLVWGSSGAGIRIPTGDGHTVQHVAMARNSALGIDLGEEGLDPLEGGTANAGQPRPHLAKAEIDTLTGDVIVTGLLAAAPNSSYTLDFFGSTSGMCDFSGYGEGEYRWTDHTVMTDEEGESAFEIALNPGVITQPVTRVTVTATDGAGNTSEFSNCIPIDLPASGEWVVNSAGDASDLNPGDGDCDTGGMVGGEPECTLRAAIEESNALPLSQGVAFDIEGVAVITPQSPLPVIGGPMLLDATTQEGYAPQDPAVTVDGSEAGESDGLVINASGVTVRGFRIANFSGDGIVIQSGTGNTISGNLIGGGGPAPGALAAGASNGGAGIRILGGDSTQVGGASPALANVVSTNGGPGVVVEGGSGATLLGLAGQGNGGLDFDLSGGDEDSFGVTANDALDADDGPNGLQNYPELTAVAVAGDVLTVSGALHSTPATEFLVNVYLGEACHPSGHGGPGVLLGGVPVVTDGSGDASFTAEFAPLAVAEIGYPLEGARVSATATGPEGTGEFGPCETVIMVPVLLRGLSAERTEAGVRISWETLPESDHVGFHVLRLEGEGERRLTGSMLTGGPRFTFTDPDPPGFGLARYVLVGYGRDGSTRRFGPVAVEAAVVDRLALRVLQNPVRERAVLQLSVPASGAVRVEVFDVQGRLVRTLADDVMSRGVHPLEWSGVNNRGERVTAGAYFLRVVIPGETRVARVVWLP